LPLSGSSLLSFGSVQELHLFGSSDQPLDPSIFPALKTLAIESDRNPQGTLSMLFQSPELSPSLETLAFLGCKLPEIFMENVARFAFERKNTPSTPLSRVVIYYGVLGLPTAESICAVEKHVSVVDVRPSKGRSDDLRWCWEWFD
jgi:hypothetical protein